MSGFLAAGVGSRAVMFAIALFNEDRTGVTTDSSATVGEFSLSGTMSLLVLGTLAGIISGPMYLGLRRWLPVTGAWRGLMFGALTLVTAGQPLFDPANVDFQIFEPVLAVVALFASLFLINGLIVTRLTDHIHPEPRYASSALVPRVVVGVIAAVALPGLLVTVGTLQTMVEDAGTCYSAAGGGGGCAVFVDDIE